MKGSVMLALAESKEEVVKALKEDVYYKSDVWDWDKVSAVIRAFGGTPYVYQF